MHTARRLIAAFTATVFLAGTWPAPLFAQNKAASAAERQVIDHFKERRLALVIGNGKYSKDPLPNPMNDAKLVAQTLRELNFEVLAFQDLGVKDLRRVTREFAQRLAREDGVGLFYYAGHAVEINGRNYLLPVDIDVTDEEQIKDDSMDLDESLMDRLEKSKKRVNLVILDACRNNPFARAKRGLGSGLARMEAPRGTLIAYATRPGWKAEDGPTGANSVYTMNLSKQMKREGLEVERALNYVAAEVSEQTRQRQLPWKSGQLLGDFYFKPIDPKVEAARRQADDAARIQEEIAKMQALQRIRQEEESDARKRLEQKLREVAEREEALKLEYAKERQAREKAEREMQQYQSAQTNQRALQQAEKDRIAREAQERERVVREAAERDKAARESSEREKLARETAEREQRQLSAAAKREFLALEAGERKRLAEQRQAEAAAQALAEKQRLAEEAMAAKLARERAEQERVAVLAASAAKKAREAEERVAAARLKEETERRARTALERERLANEAAERDRLAQKQVDAAARAQAEQPRLAQQKALAEKLAQQKALDAKLEREKMEQARLAAETAEAARKARIAEERATLARAKEEDERVLRAAAERARLARATAAQDKAAREQGETQRRAAAQIEEGRTARIRRERDAIEKSAVEREVLAKASEQARQLKERGDVERERLTKAATEAELLARTQAEQRIAQQAEDAQRVAKAQAAEQQLAQLAQERERLLAEAWKFDQLAVLQAHRGDPAKRPVEKVAAASDDSLFVRGVKLPADVAIRPPGPTVPQQCAAFSGAWGKGRWGDAQTAELWVEEIAADCSATVVSATGGVIVGNVQPAFRRVTGQVRGRTLHLQWPSTVTPRIVRTELTLDGSTLFGVRDNEEVKSKAVFQPIPAEAALQTGLFANEEVVEDSGKVVTLISRINFDQPLPRTLPGIPVLTTRELQALMAKEPRLLLLDAFRNAQHMTLPNSVWIPGMGETGLGSGDLWRIDQALRAVTDRDYDRPIVIFHRSVKNGWDGYHAMLRVIGAGYHNLYWYRGGADAWYDAGLPVVQAAAFRLAQN